MWKFLLFIALMLVGIPVALLRGVVLVDMLEWFTPIRIGVVQAVGITFIVQFFLTHLPNRYNRDDKEWWEQVVNTLIGGVIASLRFWAFAYLWHLFL